MVARPISNPPHGVLAPTAWKDHALTDDYRSLIDNLARRANADGQLCRSRPFVQRDVHRDRSSSRVLDDDHTSLEEQDRFVDVSQDQACC